MSNIEAEIARRKKRMHEMMDRAHDLENEIRELVYLINDEEKHIAILERSLKKEGGET